MEYHKLQLEMFTNVYGCRFKKLHFIGTDGKRIITVDNPFEDYQYHSPREIINHMEYELSKEQVDAIYKICDEYFS